ncbi:hypothetical protein MBLNU230_g1892t1 [Neophaeotheca triangularis]
MSSTPSEYVPDRQTLQLHQAKSLVEFTKENRGKPWQPKDPKRLLAAQRESAHRDGDEIHPLELMPVVGQPYAPSTTPFDKLDHMPLHALRTGIRHTGKALWLRRVGPVKFTQNGIFCLVMDKNGNMELLQWTVADIRLSAFTMVPASKVIVCKEPFFTHLNRKQTVIKCMHLTDLELVDATHPRTPKSLFEHGVEALELRELGKLMAQQHKDRAIELFTKALEKTHISEITLKTEILLERATCYQETERSVEGLADALAAVTEGQDEDSQWLNGKAYFHAAYAHYTLGQYAAAARLCHKAAAATPDFPDPSFLLLKIDERKKEAKGEFDFGPHLEVWSGRYPFLDIADFKSDKVGVRELRGKGAGIVAKSAISAGEVILCERAFETTFPTADGNTLFREYNAHVDKTQNMDGFLLAKIITKLSKNPSLIKCFPELATVTNIESKEPLLAINTFKLRDVVINNAAEIRPPFDEQVTEEFGFSEGGKIRTDEDNGRGFWLTASRLNHSCVANAVNVHIGDVTLVRAWRDIAAGEEVTINYIHSLQGLQDRQKQLRGSWGFECVCLRCAAEMTETAAVLKRREKLMAEGEELTTKYHPQSPEIPSSVVARMETLAKHIEESYDQDLFEEIPRISALSATHWLARYHRASGSYAGFLAATGNFFRLCGFSSTNIGAGDANFTPSKTSFLPFWGVQLLVQAAFVNFFLLKERKVGLALEKRAKELYVVMNGVEAGFRGMAAAAKENGVQ